MNLRRHSLTISFIVALIIFFIGFGALFMLYTVMPHIEYLPGLFDYRAATFGDAICLPLIAGSLTYIHLTHGKLQERFQKCVRIAALVFGIIGVLMQAKWLISDKTVLNWTIPELHRFNVAGWYHAFFFVFMFVLIGGLFVRYCFIRTCGVDIIKRNGIISWSDIIAETIFWFSGSWFLLLHNIDNYTSNNTVFRVLFITAIAVLCIALFITIGLRFFVKHQVQKHAVIPVLSGVMTAFALANIVSGKVEIDCFYLISCALLIIVLVVPDKNHLKQMIAMYLVIAVPTITMEMAISTQSGSLLNMVVVFLLAVITPCCIAACQHDTSGVNVLRKGIFVTITVLIYISVLVIVFVLRDTSDYSDLFEMLLNFVLVYAVPMYVKSTFQHIKDAEDRNDKEELRGLQPIMYGLYICLYVGAAILIFRTLLPNLVLYIPRQLMFGNDSWIGIVLLGIAVIFFIILSQLKKKSGESNNSLNRSLGCVSLCIGYLGVILFLGFVLSGINTPVINHISIKWIIGLSVCMWFGLSVTLSLGFRANMCLIRGVPVDRHINTAAAIIGTGIAVSSIMAEFQMIYTYSVLGIIVDSICVAISTVLLPFLVGRILESERPDSQVVVNNPISGILQDGALFGMLAIMCQLLTVFFIGELIRTDVTLSSITGLIITAVVYLALISWPLQYCARNNIEHYEKRKNEQKSDNTLIKALLKHLQTQNINTIIIALPYSLYFIVGEAFSHAMSEEDAKDFLYRFIPHDE